MHEALLDLPFPHYGASDFFILLQYSRLSTYVPIASLSDDRSAASPFAHCGRYQPCQRCAKPRRHLADQDDFSGQIKAVASVTSGLSFDFESVDRGSNRQDRQSLKFLGSR
jgi:hypothetical protein